MCRPADVRLHCAGVQQLARPWNRYRYLSRHEADRRASARHDGVKNDIRTGRHWLSGGTGIGGIADGGQCKPSRVRSGNAQVAASHGRRVVVATAGAIVDKALADSGLAALPQRRAVRVDSAAVSWRLRCKQIDQQKTGYSQLMSGIIRCIEMALK